MFKGMRRHINATSVVAVMALVLAMSGGAWAAKRYLITSTNQISPKVLSALKGKVGKAGPAGPAGAPGTGAAGAQEVLRARQDQPDQRALLARTEQA